MSRFYWLVLLLTYFFILSGCSFNPRLANLNSKGLQISLSVEESEVEEGSRLEFSLSIPKEINSDVLINLKYPENFQAGVHYSDAANQVILPAGQKSILVSMNILLDGVYQVNLRDFFVEASGPEINTEKIFFKLKNKDPFPLIQATTTEASEGGTAVIKFTLDRSADVELEFPYTTVPGTAGSGDFTSSAAVLSFPPGKTQAEVSIALGLNATCEDDKNFFVNVTPPSPSTQALLSVEQKITENTPRTYTMDNPTVIEGDAGVVTLTASVACPFPVSLAYSTQNGTAVAGVHYQAISNQNVVFPANQSTLSLPVQTLDSQTDGPDVDFLIKLLSLDDGSTLASGTVLIHDSNPEPALSWTLASQSVGRAAGSAQVQWTLSAASEYVITATLALSGTAVKGTDYQILNTTLSIPAKTTSGTVNISLLNSATFRGDSFNLDLTFTDLDHAVLGAPGTHTLTITDTPPVISVSSSATLIEGAAATYKVSLSKPSLFPISVNYATTDGTGIAGTDYAAATGRVDFAPSETSKDVSVASIDNSVVCQADRSFSFAVMTPVNATLGSTVSVSTAIKDNDDPTLSIPAASVTEGDKANFAVSLSEACAYDLRFSLRTQNLTAIAGKDYNSATATITISAGEVSAVFSVQTRDDLIDQGSREFQVFASNPFRVKLPAAPTTMTILDNDSPPVLTFATETMEALDSVGVVTVDVKLSHAAARPVTASLSFGGSAVYGEDYTLSPTSVNLATNSSSQTLTISILKGNIPPEGKTVVLTLDGVSGGSLAAPSEFSLLIRNDPKTGIPIVSLGDSSAVAYLTSYSGINVLSVGNPGNSIGARVSRASNDSPKISQFIFSGDQQKFIFIGNNDRVGGQDLFSVRLDGSLRTRLNPSGWGVGRNVQEMKTLGTSSKVAFLAGQAANPALFDLYSVNTDSSSLISLVGGLSGGKEVMSFDVAADGSKIVYLSNVQNLSRKELYSINPNGTNNVKLNGTLANGYNVDEYAITPDSTKVVFTLKDDAGGSALYAIPIAGGATTLLSASMSGRAIGSFKISPDSSRVLYTHNVVNASNLDLFSVNMNGSARTQINQNLISGGSVAQFEISSNSATVLYLAETQIKGAPELYAAAPNGSNRSRLSGILVSGGKITEARFTPDSKSVVYLGYQDSATSQELYSVSITGADNTKLNIAPVTGGQIREYLISKDSSKVLYTGDQNLAGTIELFAVSLTGGDRTNLTPTLVSGRKVNAFFLLPDSSRVLYRANSSDNNRYDWYAVQLNGGNTTKLFSP